MKHIAKTIGIRSYWQVLKSSNFCSDVLTVCSAGPFYCVSFTSLVLQYVATGLINEVALLTKLNE